LTRYLISKTIIEADNRWIAYLMALRLGIKNPIIKKRLEKYEVIKI